MALRATIHGAGLSVADIDCGCYADHALTTACHPSEAKERMVIRLLAFALCDDVALAFGAGLSIDDEPDLAARDPTGEIETWIDVGWWDERRVRRARSRRAGRDLRRRKGRRVLGAVRRYLGALRHYPSDRGFGARVAGLGRASASRDAPALLDPGRESDAWRRRRAGELRAHRATSARLTGCQRCLTPSSSRCPAPALPRPVKPGQGIRCSIY